MANQPPEEGTESGGDSAAEDEPIEPPAVHEPQDHPWRVTAEELTSLDLESPIQGDNCADPGCFEQRFFEASKQADEHQSAVYRLLAIICSFHFKPTDKIEPFSNQWAMNGKRSLQGSDFDQAQIGALYSALPRFENLALRTRIADLIWIRDRQKSDCGRSALAGYVQLAHALLVGIATDRFDLNPKLGMTTQNCLSRAAIIARQMGWGREEHEELREIMIEAVRVAKSNDDRMAVVRFGRLALGHGLEMGDILDDLDALAFESAQKSEFHEAESLQRLSIAAAQRQRAKDEVQQRTLKLTEIFELKADVSDSPLLKTHALQEAIDTLQGLKGVRETRQRLHEKLTESQLHLFEEMGQFEHSIDLTEEVQRILSQLDGADLLECLKALAITELPKSPSLLKEGARKTIREHPLSSLFATSILDAKGRTIARVGGAALDEEEDESDALIHQIIKQEEIRVGIAVAGAIDPIRGLISQRFTVNFDVLEKICAISPFVPSGSEAAFARGVQAFLAGDDLAAAMILVPYLEAGLRAMVGVAGRSDTKIATGGLEELIGLGAMLGQHRDALETVFGPALVFAIEIVFVHEFGPKVRHSLCHGLSRDGAFFSEWYIYACKLIYSLILLPLIGRDHWPVIRTAIVAETSLSEAT